MELAEPSSVVRQIYRLWSERNQPSTHNQLFNIDASGGSRGPQTCRIRIEADNFGYLMMNMDRRNVAFDVFDPKSGLRREYLSHRF
jgi:hypothetical protein